MPPTVAQIKSKQDCFWEMLAAGALAFSGA